MTICDAAKYLEGLFADKNVGDDIEGIVQEEIEAAQVAVWLLHDRMRRDALQPLDENGLARCGVCGKSPTYEEFNDGFFDLDRVECRDCGVMVTSACGKSKAKWNAMRGVKEADE